MPCGRLGGPARAPPGRGSGARRCPGALPCGAAQRSGSGSGRAVSYGARRFGSGSWPGGVGRGRGAVCPAGGSAVRLGLRPGCAVWCWAVWLGFLAGRGWSGSGSGVPCGRLSGPARAPAGLCRVVLGGLAWVPGRAGVGRGAGPVRGVSSARRVRVRPGQTARVARSSCGDTPHRPHSPRPWVAGALPWGGDTQEGPRRTSAQPRPPCRDKAARAEPRRPSCGAPPHPPHHRPQHHPTGHRRATPQGQGRGDPRAGHHPTPHTTAPQHHPTGHRRATPQPLARAQPDRLTAEQPRRGTAEETLV